MFCCLFLFPNFTKAQTASELVNIHRFPNATALNNVANPFDGSLAFRADNTSDKRFKENVQDNVVGLDFIMNLEPVTYNFNNKAMDLYLKGIDTISSKQHYDDMYKVQHIGFLAQDVETLADSLNFDFHGIDKPENSKGVLRTQIRRICSATCQSNARTTRNY